MRQIDEHDDLNWELNRRLDRDEEREPRAPIAARRKQFRYWSGLSFRPARSSDVRSAA